MPIWSQVCLVPAVVLFAFLLPVHPTMLLPARRQFPNGIEWVSSWLSILPQRKPMLLGFFFSFLWISHSWRVAGSPCFPSIECSFQLLFSNHWLNMHVCVFFSPTLSHCLLHTPTGQGASRWKSKAWFLGWNSAYVAPRFKAKQQTLPTCCLRTAPGKLGNKTA